MPEEGHRCCIIEILQGEEALAKHCLSVARTTVWNVRDCVLVRYDMDEDGILKVTAKGQDEYSGEVEL